MLGLSDVTQTSIVRSLTSRELPLAVQRYMVYCSRYCPSEVAITLINSKKIYTFSGLPTYDQWSLGCITYHLIFGSPLYNVDSQNNNGLLSVFLYHCFHFFAMFMFLLLTFLGVLKIKGILGNKD